MRVAHLADLHEKVRVLEARVAEIRTEQEALDMTAIDDPEVISALQGLRPGMDGYDHRQAGAVRGGAGGEGHL